jgi:predicted permease
MSAIAGILVSLALAFVACRACKSNRPVTGAIMLAAAFPNATYMGIPLQESLFGPWARSVVIQFDLFACFPLVLTLGMLIASHFGEHGKKENPFLIMFKVVPLWAAFIAVMLNINHVPQPGWLKGLLSQLSSAVIPLMLISVGLALLRGMQEWRKLKTVIPVAIIQLFVMPIVVWFVAKTSGLQGDILKITVLEGALPSMALGIVVSDRYGLNTGVYASALTLTTLLSIFTLPLWVQWLGGV